MIECAILLLLAGSLQWKPRMAKNHIYAFLPYIRTRESCYIRGIQFRNISYVKGLDEEIKDHVETLGHMFFTWEGGRILEPSYSVIPFSSEEERTAINKKLMEAQLLVIYLYGSPHHLPTQWDDHFLSAECSTLYTFISSDRIFASEVYITDEEVQHGRVSHEDPYCYDKEKQTEYFDGYKGYRNQKLGLSVIKGSRIYPEVPNIILNYSQYLDDDLERYLGDSKNWALHHLVGGKTSSYKYNFHPKELSDENNSRIFGSLRWYSKSCREVSDDEEKLLFLAVAFETLLGLPKGRGVTDRFKDAVSVLVGPVPRLDEWLSQFYSRRSDIVHDGKASSLSFTLEGKTSHRALNMYGRILFRICFNAVLTGIILTEKSQIASLLIHNNERLDSLCKILNGPGKNTSEAILELEDTVEELHICKTLGYLGRLEVDLSKLMGVSRLFLSSCQALKTKVIDALDQDISKTISLLDEKSYTKAIKLLEDIVKSLRRAVRAERTGSKVDEIVLRYLEFASDPSVSLESYYYEKDRRS